MTLVDKLLKADVEQTKKKEEKVLKSKRLAKILGEEESVEITIRELPAKLMNELVSKQFDNKGNFDMQKSFDAKALTCAEGIVEPNLRTPQLWEHFGVGTPKDLAILLFGAEINTIADEITKLSGFSSVEDTDDEIKNS